MVALIVRILAILFLVGFVIYGIQHFVKPFSKKNDCPKCDGKGYWMGTRGRDRCDVCKGTGKVA